MSANARGRQMLFAASVLGLGFLPVHAAVNVPFSIQQRDGITWLQKPDGDRFFSLGVCVVNQGASRDDFSPTNPGYAVWQHYRDSNQWAEATAKRMKSWGFSTVGGWSDFLAFGPRSDADIFFTPVLHVGSTCGVPWWDMWDTNIIARMHQVARDQILPLRESTISPVTVPAGAVSPTKK